MGPGDWHSAEVSGGQELFGLFFTTALACVRCPVLCRGWAIFSRTIREINKGRNKKYQSDICTGNGYRCDFIGGRESSRI